MIVPRRVIQPITSLLAAIALTSRGSASVGAVAVAAEGKVSVDSVADTVLDADEGCVTADRLGSGFGSMFGAGFRGMVAEGTATLSEDIGRLVRGKASQPAAVNKAMQTAITPKRTHCLIHNRRFKDNNLPT